MPRAVDARRRVARRRQCWGRRAEAVGGATTRHDVAHSRVPRAVRCQTRQLTARRVCCDARLARVSAEAGATQASRAGAATWSGARTMECPIILMKKCRARLRGRLLRRRYTGIEAGECGLQQKTFFDTHAGYGHSRPRPRTAVFAYVRVCSSARPSGHAQDGRGTKFRCLTNPQPHARAAGRHAQSARKPAPTSPCAHIPITHRQHRRVVGLPGTSHDNIRDKNRLAHNGGGDASLHQGHSTHLRLRARSNICRASQAIVAALGRAKFPDILRRAALLPHLCPHGLRLQPATLMLSTWHSSFRFGKLSTLASTCCC